MRVIDPCARLSGRLGGHSWTGCVGHVGKKYFTHVRPPRHGFLTSVDHRQRSAGGDVFPYLREHYVIVAVDGHEQLSTAVIHTILV